MNDISVKPSVDTLVKGNSRYYTNRFCLYKIPFNELIANDYFRKIIRKCSENKKNDDDFVYILSDESQFYNQQYFVKFPYQDAFIQQCSHDSKHALHSPEYGEESTFMIGTISEYSSPYSYNLFYEKNQVIIRSNKICYCGFLGSFSIGERLNMSDDEIENVVNKYHFQYLDSVYCIFRSGYNTASKEYILCLNDNIYNNQKIYTINVEKNSYQEGTVEKCLTMRDGGTTDIEYTVNNIHYHFHLDTPLKQEPVHTLNDIPCIADITKDDYERLYELFYNIVGFKLLKN